MKLTFGICILLLFGIIAPKKKSPYPLQFFLKDPSGQPVEAAVGLMDQEGKVVGGESDPHTGYVAVWVEQAGVYQFVAYPKEADLEEIRWTTKAPQTSPVVFTLRRRP